MAANEDMVTGGGWISDDSSFYGDENEQEYHESHSHQTTPKAFWSSHSKDLNAVVSPVRLQARKNTASDEDTTPSKKVMPLAISRSTNKPPEFSGNYRRAMDEERSTKLAKGKHTQAFSSERLARCELFNPMEGQPYSWQLGETSDAFVKRVPPLTTSAFTCEWIWAANPYRDPHDKPASPRIAAFEDRGAKLLADSLLKRNEIQEKGQFGPRSALIQAWNKETRALQESLTKLAVDTGILSGKWMLFLKIDEVTQAWRNVVEAVITDHLGPMAKVATDNGRDERLICVYTKDFRDEGDVLRVLQELERLGFLRHEQSIYYKSDAYTYLDLYSATANKYGLQASLYNSHKMLAAARTAQLSMSQNTVSQREQKILERFY